MKTPEVRILGCGTCQIEPHRAASSVLVELGEQRLVYDMGRGISSRLVELGYKNDEIEHILISHFHPDHVSDLIPFLQAAAWSQTDPRNKDLYIYGPAGIKKLIQGYYDVFGEESLSPDRYNIHVEELAAGEHNLAGLTVEYIELPPASNHGIRFRFKDEFVAVTGDSDFHQQEIDFLNNVDIAIFDSGHLTDEEIIELASKSNPRKMYCSHLYRELNIASLQTLAEEKGFTGKLLVAQDLQVVL